MRFTEFLNAMMPLTQFWSPVENNSLSDILSDGVRTSYKMHVYYRVLHIYLLFVNGMPSNWQSSVVSKPIYLKSAYGWLPKNAANACEELITKELLS